MPRLSRCQQEVKDAIIKYGRENDFPEERLFRRMEK